MPEATWKWRMVVRGWFRESWIDASAELRARIFAEWIDVHRGWLERGCRLILTMDDTTAVGRIDGSRCNFYTVWEIPEPGVVRELLAPIWDEKAERPLRLAEYFTVETVVGKPVITMELALGGTELPTQVREA